MGADVAPMREAQETFSSFVRLTEEKQAATRWMAERPGSACSAR
jgi:hypothetical protein